VANLCGDGHRGPLLPDRAVDVADSAVGGSAAASASASTSLRFTPPRELTQRPPLPRPSAASSDGEAMAMVGREFSPPREFSQRPAAEERDLAIVAESAPAAGRVGTKREKETREQERLKVIPRSGSLGLDAFMFYS